MTLYHGSLEIVERPLVLPRRNGKTSDFGVGFYTTTDFNQAERWARIRKGANQSQKGYVSEFAASDDLFLASDLKILSFDSATPEWLDFVIANRRKKDFSHGYDIVRGSVANDRVYATIALYEDEFLDKAETIARLKTFVLANQVLFHTEKSLGYLHFSRSVSI